MKIVFSQYLAGAVSLAAAINIQAQFINPTLRISKPAADSVRLDWNSQAGQNYEVLFTPNIDPFSLWTPASGSIAATGPNTGVTLQRPTSPVGFFKLEGLNLPTTGLPTARITSHTDGQVVFGLIHVLVSAQDDSRLSSVALLIDGEEQDITLTEGALEWVVNTGHFSNGPHTLVARAQDNAGIGYLGGNAGANVTANEGLSAPITLNFANVVRWVEPASGFDSFVPVSIRSDIFPSDWTVFVQDGAGTVVRTFSGTTSDGVVETAWDGNDNNGIPVPSEAGYRVLFTLGSAFPAGAAGTRVAGIQPGIAAPIPPSLSYNQYGVQEYEYEVKEEIPPLPGIFFDAGVQGKIAKGLLPPLPPLTNEQLGRDRALPTILTRKVRLPGPLAPRIGAAPLAGLPPPGPPVWNDDLVWRELPWASGEILLARQEFLGVLPVFNTAAAANLATLMSDIQLASGDDPRLEFRTVYSFSVSVCKADIDYDTLMNDLTQPNVRDFYYIGHSDGDSIGYSEGAKNNGITSDRVRKALRNFSTQHSFKHDGRWSLTFRKPFRFVFIDGCLSAKGMLVEAFGIIADNDHTRLGKKRRASLGWTTTVKDSIINSNQENWSAHFWKNWIDVPNSNYDIELQDAVTATTAMVAIPMNPIIKGYHKLTWAD